MRIHSTVSTTARRRELAVLAMSAALALPAMAATYYASPTGSGTAPARWRAVVDVEGELLAGRGYVVILLAGTYSTSINPANSGNAKRAHLVRGQPREPGLVVVPSIQPSRSTSRSRA